MKEIKGTESGSVRVHRCRCEHMTITPFTPILTQYVSIPVQRMLCVEYYHIRGGPAETEAGEGREDNPLSDHYAVG